MKHLLLLPLLFCCCSTVAQKYTTSDSLKKIVRLRETLPINKYKNSIGLHFILGNGIIEMDKKNITLDVITPVVGISYERFIYKRYALNAFYAYARTYSNEKNIMGSMFLNAKINTIRIDNRLYIKKTKDHVFLSFGAVMQWRYAYSDTIGLNFRQANLTVGFGYCINLKQIFKKMKTDRFAFEMFVDQGLNFTKMYPGVIRKYDQDFINPKVSVKMVGIKYYF